MKKYRIWIAGYCAILLITLLTAHLGNKTVAVIAESVLAQKSSSIVIDAGHGGVDGGAISCTGLPESGFNLEIALRLQDLLQLLGCETVMIRTEDVSVYTEGETIAQKKISDLKERVRRINETPNAILVSIHQNTFPDSRYSGPQVFYAGVEGSENIAGQLQAALTTHLGIESRRQEKKSTGVYLMEHISCPGVLIECGFLSNPAEEAKLRDAAYQKKLCAVIACVLSENIPNT